MKRNTISVKVGEQEIIFETGKIARQANGAVIVRCGDTYLLNTACANAEAAAESDFLPLRVDYQEKFSAAGRTLSGFIKREGRPTEKETLVSRLIDRPIRPMFEDGYFNEVQLLSYVLSYDGSTSP
jgi:polyribonucleotide nucleotidyltransferase